MRRRSKHKRCSKSPRLNFGSLDDTEPEKGWSPDGKEWLKEKDLQVVLFLDECIRDKDARFFRMFNFMKTLTFPTELRGIGCPDDRVLESIFIFIKNSLYLAKTSNDIQFYIITQDTKFKDDANYKMLARDYARHINIIYVPQRINKREAKYRNFLCHLINEVIIF